MPQDISEHGWRIDALIEQTSYLVLLVAIVALLSLGYVLVAHRSGRTARWIPGTSRRAAALPVSVAALLFVFIDGNLLVTSARDLSVFDASSAEPADVFRVQIMARQWSWDVRYPGLDDRFGTADDIVALNDLRVPLGREVRVELRAADVIHSFYLPNARVKQDAIPGRTTRARFKVRVSGLFEIGCAQFCGVHHYKMRATLSVVSNESLAPWLASESTDALRVTREYERSGGEIADPRGWGWMWGR